MAKEKKIKDGGKSDEARDKLKGKQQAMKEPPPPPPSDSPRG